jgi:hypothetical protein
MEVLRDFCTRETFLGSVPVVPEANNGSNIYWLAGCLTSHLQRNTKKKCIISVLKVHVVRFLTSDWLMKHVHMSI